MNSRSASTINKRDRVESVYLVEYNHLGENYVRSVVKGCHRLRVVRCCHGGILPCPDISTPLFLIDAESLPIRLFELVHWVRYSLPKSRILVIASDLSSGDVCELVAAGIQGIVSCKEVAKYLNPAIQSIMAGRLWLRRDILEQFALYSSSSLALNHRKRSIITPQETRVIALLRQKYSNKEIGTTLGITERTVKFHLANVFTKVGAHDRASALDVILRSGLCQPSNNMNSNISADCEPHEDAVLARGFPWPNGRNPAHLPPHVGGGCLPGGNESAAEAAHVSQVWKSPPRCTK